MGVTSWQFDDLEALWESEAHVYDLHKKLQAHSQQTQTNQLSGASAPLTAPTGPPPVLAGWPALGAQAAVWPQVERLMVQHGLRLLSLQLEPTNHVGGWPSQTVALRLQGRFEDWVTVWAALNARGPFWAMERLRITPQEAGVAVDAVLRLWLSPAAADETASAQVKLPTEWMFGDAPVALGHRASAPVFVQNAAPPANAFVAAAGPKDEAALPVSADIGARSNSGAPVSRASTPPEAPLSSDPAEWPLDQIRVAGVWQSEESVQLILQAGPHWVRARLGQRMGPHGHVVHGIDAEAVHLRAAQGAVWVIGLEKAKP